MKPAPFQYFAPREVNEALHLLKQHGEEAKILAGGQSLMPLMSFRLARPAVIIDINRISGLDSISAGTNGGLTIGALTRQRAVERSKTVQDRNPLLAAAMPLIGHFQIRNRGTFGGSLVHADPAAELPAVGIALGMEFVLRSAQGDRVVPAEDFFLGYMATAVEPSELLTEIRIPSWKPGTGWAIDEVSRRKGDFAMVGVTVLVQLDGDACRDSCIVIFGVGGKPVRMHKAEGMLKGKKLGRQTLTDIGETVANDLEPDSDIHASAQYRKEVGGVLTRRALESALARAKESGRK
ncbi:MAG: xanthine dehydrogenase family protein subunit M [Deltaproteobacteria bacterium]|nr:xanthine dehydrogenase family protein subunit M [Deltaproteobacteria bacterium]